MEETEMYSGKNNLFLEADSLDTEEFILSVLCG